MSDLFGAPPPPEPAKRRAAAAPAPRKPAAAASAAPPEPALGPPQAPITPAPPRLYSQVTLCDGRQVDSWAEDWRMECLARHLLTLEPQERDDWLRGHPLEAELRQAMDGVRATKRGSGDHPGRSV